jgi:hypothetical protein
VKLKVDKRFQAMKVDVEDELFRNGIFEFNITKLIAFIFANPEQFPAEFVALDTLWESPNRLTTEPVQPIDLSIPIILAEISPGRINVIDGNHRVEEARSKGIKALPAYKLRPEQHHRFLTSENAYKKYVQYWNSKVAEASWAIAISQRANGNFDIRNKVALKEI